MLMMIFIYFFFNDEKLSGYLSHSCARARTLFSYFLYRKYNRFGVYICLDMIVCVCVCVYICVRVIFLSPMLPNRTITTAYIYENIFTTTIYCTPTTWSFLLILQCNRLFLMFPFFWSRNEDDKINIKYNIRTIYTYLAAFSPNL